VTKYNFTPKGFWENKILDWEQGRYGDQSARTQFLERWANRSSDSLRFRLTIAKSILIPHVAGKRVVEIGCGSGLLAEDILAAGAQSYLGIDIADAAIASAQARFENSQWHDAIQFRQGEVTDLPDDPADIIFSLGLLDWLSDEEMDKLFNHYAGCDFLHAISERRFSISQLVHRLYCLISYGYKNLGYVPRYYHATDFDKWTDGTLNVYRDYRLSFGALLTTLPLNNHG
jgi:2-polyprenyl-3-methyl-5-hydroxy-6-metoxy-1,4-benzoquinol methylase